MKQEFGYGVSQVQAQEVSAYQAEVVKRESGRTARGFRQVSAGLGQLGSAAANEQKEQAKSDDKALQVLADSYHALKQEGITGEAAEAQLAETGLTPSRIQRKLAQAGGIDNLREPAFRYRLSELDGQTAWYEAKASLDLIDDEVVKLLAGMGLTEEDADGNVVPVNVEDYEARAAAMYEAALDDITKELSKDPLSLATFQRNSIPDVGARVTAAKKKARRVREVDYARQTGESLMNGLDMFFSGKDTWGHPVDGDSIGKIFESIWKANYANVAEQDKGALASSFIASVGAEVGRRVADGTINPRSEDGAEDLEELFDAIEESLPPDMEADHREVFDALEELRGEFASTELERITYKVREHDTRLSFTRMGMEPVERVAVGYATEGVRASVEDPDDPTELQAKVKEMETLFRSSKDDPTKRAELAEYLSTQFNTVSPEDAPKLFLATMQEVRDMAFRAEERQYTLDTRDRAQQDRDEASARRKKSDAEKESADNAETLVNNLQAFVLKNGKVTSKFTDENHNLVQSLNSKDSSKYNLVLERVAARPELPGNLRQLVASGRDQYRSVFIQENSETTDRGVVPTYTEQQLNRATELYAQAEEQIIGEILGDPNLLERMRDEPEKLKSEIVSAANDRARSLRANDFGSKQTESALTASQAFAGTTIAPVGRSLPGVGVITDENFLDIIPEVFTRSGIYTQEPQKQQKLAQDAANALERLNRPELAKGSFIPQLADVISDGLVVGKGGKRRPSNLPGAFEAALGPLAEQYASGDQVDADAAAFTVNYLLLSNGMVPMGDDGTEFRDHMTAASEAMSARAEKSKHHAGKRKAFEARAEFYANMALMPIDLHFATFEKAMLYKAPEFAPGGKYFGIYLEGEDDLNYEWEAGGLTFKNAYDDAAEQLRMMLDTDHVSQSQVYQWMVSQSQITP